MPTHQAHVADFGSHKIYAIKLVRQLSGLGLKDAKDVTERGGSFAVRVDATALAEIEEAEARGIRLVFDPPLSGAATEPAFASSDGYAIRYLSGDRKINAIKLVRELAGCGLKQAKDLVEQQGTFLVGQSASEARSVVARFEAIGSCVEVVADDGHGVQPRAADVATSQTDDFYNYDDGLDF